MSGWTEGGAAWNKGAAGVLGATREVEERLPFAWLGFDSDHGGEFLNHHLHSYMIDREEAVEFTRSRPYHSDDNAHVEQKNRTWARQLLGYSRLEDPELAAPISALYREVWAPWQNFFLPGFKLAQKWREGSHWRKRYELPRTAYQRLCAPGMLGLKARPPARFTLLSDPKKHITANVLKHESETACLLRPLRCLFSMSQREIAESADFGENEYMSVAELPITIDRERIAAFCRERMIRRLSLFGSVLRGDFDPQSSDVDVVVEFRRMRIPD